MAELFTARTEVKPGDRVRIQGQPIGVRLRSRYGTVEQRADYDGYWRVRLDELALCCDPAQVPGLLVDIIEHEDNLIVGERCVGAAGSS